MTMAFLEMSLFWGLFDNLFVMMSILLKRLIVVELDPDSILICPFFLLLRLVRIS